ncbi:MAG: hypothetical protein A3K10_00790 [Bacteroidetes bacterium RIFCSPLOWO2_12_FULL_31_6]|nr:MAG: hypothetical protein A3K10_00790 [Bacteroidetes bacterium RIFCSPLOWO2_12_FULL_31_6]
MALTKVLITVKTYPAISTKYEELVCTAGFREDGTWIRIYPLQFRKKPYQQQYEKYQWIEIDLVENESDFRPESYRPITHDTEIKIVGKIPTDGDSWLERRKIVLNKEYFNLTELIAEAKDKNTNTSLAVFKPSKILDFVWEAEDREWDEKKLATLKQYNLFEINSKNKLEVVKKLPYKFSYIFEDDHGKRSKLMIEDWETGALFWNMLRKYNSEERACQEVRRKYLDDFAKTKDLYFFLGTTMKNHYVSRNPFIIIGTFYPKKITQATLDF